MKKAWLNLIVLGGLLVALASASGISVAERGDSPSFETATKASGMPGRPVPEHPISHHGPGQLSRVADVKRDVTRMNAVGIEETVELTGLNALLADGTMSDPFAGNYDVVNLDQILLVKNSNPAVEALAWGAFEEPDVIANPTLIPDSLAQVGNTTVWGTPAIAAGDLDGNNQAEQIAAWRDYGTARAFLSIGGLPGTEGKASSDPAAVAHNSGQLDLLVRGYDNALWHRHYDGAAWGEWNSNAGGYLMSGPTLASRGDGQFDVFVAGVYNDTSAIYQRHWTGSAWSADWDMVDVHPSDGVELLGDPAATARGTNQIDLFRRASDNTLRWLHYDGAAWGTWQNLGGFITSAPTVVSWNADHLQVFAQGFDGALWYRDLGGSLWGEWQRQDGLTLTSKPTAVPLLKGLVAHWKLDDGSGTTASDSSGNGHAGTLSNGPTWITDTAPTNFSNPYALQLDGVDDYARVSDHAQLRISDDFALAFWFKSGSTAQSDKYLLARNEGGTPGSQVAIVYEYVDDTVEFYSQGHTGDDPRPGSQLPLADTNWHHIAYAYDGATWAGYLDGTQVFSVTRSFSLSDDALDGWFIGASSASGGYVNGLMDEVRIYNRALLPAEVQALAAGNEPTSNQDHQLHVYARGEDHALWWNSLSGATWSGWESLGGTLDSGAAAALHNTQVDLFAQTTDGHLQQNSHVSVGGAGWQDSGGLKTCCWNYDTGVSAARVAVETGYFTGDGREQIVLAYSTGSTYGVKLYDIQDGFRPDLLADKEWNDALIDGSNVNYFTIDVSTGDLNGDGRDEIGLVVSGKRTDGTNWNTGTFVLSVTNTDPWTLDEKWSDEPVDLDNTFGAFVITSGDLDGNGEDEFATAWTRCGIPFGWANPYCDAQMILYDYEENWNINSTQVFFYGHGHHEYPDLDLAAADLDLDPETRADEIVYAGIAAPEFGSELSVWSAKTFTDAQKIEVETLPVEELPFKLTIGDFNRDLKPEVAFLNHVGTAGNPMQLALYGYDETGTFGVLASLEQAQTTWSAGGLFDLAAGDLSGESLRVGPPTYRREKSANNIVAILNTPPTHRDTLDGQEYIIGGDDSYSIYEKEEQTENSFSHSFSHNWSLDVDASIGAGDPRGTHIIGSLEQSYGGHFEHANMTSESVLWNQSVQATTDDVLLFSYSDYDIWEYPVYADSDRSPDSYIAVVFPIEGSTGIHTSPGNLCQSWYKPTHQVDNIWSYPLDEVDFNGYDPDDDDSHLYIGSITTGGAEYDWIHQMTTNDTSQLSHREYAGVMAGLEVQIGGDEVEASGGFIIEAKTKTRGPFIKANWRGGYNFEYLGESKASITEQTTVKTHIGTVSPDSSYSSESHLFWAEEGYLKLDYTANPEPHAFWNLYDKPDPTFIRPWVDGRCGADEIDYTRDIEIWPFYANRGETVTISATVRNYSNVTANDVKVRFYLGDPDDGGQQIGSDQTIPALARAVGPETVAVEWTASGSGVQRIYAVLDPDNELEEMHDEANNVNNNRGYNLIKIGKADYIDPAMSAEHAYYRLAYGLDTGALAAARLFSSAQTPSLTFDAYVAPDNLGEVVLFSFTSLDEVPTAPQGMAPIGDVVALEAFRVGDASQVFDLKPSPALPPGIITVQYSEADLHGTPEEDLRLYTWTGTEWSEPTCAGHTLLHLTEDNMFVAPICETGTFALFGNPYKLYLPLVTR